MLVDYLPDIFKDISAFIQITDVEDTEIDTIKELVTDYFNQKFVENATWGLAYWEKELGLEINPSDVTYDERRSRIKSKLRGTGKVDSDLIKEVVDSWTNGDVDVTFDSKINIKFNSVLGIPTAIEDVKQAVEDIKPAHLDTNYIIAYLVISEVEGMTVSEVEFMALDKFAGGEV